MTKATPERWENVRKANTRKCAECTRLHSVDIVHADNVCPVQRAPRGEDDSARKAADLLQYRKWSHKTCPSCLDDFVDEAAHWKQCQ